jgi:hypothetical protein
MITFRIEKKGSKSVVQMTGRALRQEPDLGQHAWHALLVLLPQGDAPARMGAKNAIFF